MGEMAFDSTQTGRQGVYGGVSESKGGVSPKKHKLHRSNIEQEANDAMNEKRIAGIVDKFPMQVHKVGGLVRRVKNEDELADALAKGWKADIRDVLAESAVPETIYQMTAKQARKLVAEHAGDGAKLAELLREEQTHGNRAEIVDIIMAAADAVGAPAKAPKAAKAEKAGAKRKK